MTLAIKAGLLIDGNGGEALKNAIVLVEGETITAVGPADKVAIPADAEIIDASGKTVMPGLIDCHVHMMINSAALEDHLFTPKAVTYYQAAENLKRTLRAGFTTIRDAGEADAGMRQSLEMGLITGPRLVVSGKIGQTGGLMELRYPSGSQIVNQESWRICDGVADVRKTVRKVLREEVDFVKTFATGGVVAPQGSPFIPEWTLPELQVMVEEASRRGVGVMAHAESAVGVKNALRAGVTSIEHGYALDQEAIDLFLEKDIFLVATLHISKVVAQRQASLSEVSKRKKEQLLKAQAGWFRKACQAGVKVALGSDAFIADMHGANAVELELMMDTGGISAMKAITAGTKNAAECCLLGDKVGTLEAGKAADILLVDGNPLDDITVLQHPERIRVYQAGIPVEE